MTTKQLSNRILVAPLALVGALAVLLVAPLVATAGEPTDQLKQRLERVIKVVDDPNLKAEGRAKERRVAVRKIATEIFDFPETARRALGRHWQARTPGQREEFVRLFTDLLEESYIGKIDLYQGEKVTYVAETVEGEQATVKTRIVTKQGSEVPIEYRMHKDGDRWLVYDVVIEGVSLIANYRSQFNKIIQTSSFEDLVAKMKAKAFTSPEGARDRRT